MSDINTDHSPVHTEHDTQSHAAHKPTVNHHKKPSKWNDTLSTIGVILLAPIVAVILTQFVFQSYQVDGESMETTLQDRDRLIVTKTAKTWARVTGKDYIPARYDIVIFNHSSELSADGRLQEKQLVKRVIGLPGDHVSVKDSVVTVFNKEHPKGYLIDREGPEKNVITTTPGVIEETVKPGEIYVMGDNRNNSLDSRSFGAVRSQDVVGRLALRIYPFDKTDKF